MQAIPVAFCLALASAGKSIPARMAMIAMTTSNSIKVKAERLRRFNLSILILWVDGEIGAEPRCRQWSFASHRGMSPRCVRAAAPVRNGCPDARPKHQFDKDFKERHVRAGTC